MKKFLLGILVGFVLAALGAVIFFFVAVKISQRRPTIADNSVLMLQMDGDIPESPPVEIPLPFFQRRAPATVRENWQMLQMAAVDPKIHAVVFMPQGVTAGWAKLQELRQDLLAFRKSGKPVYAFLRAPTSRDYYMATAADRIYMSREDYLDLKGLRAEGMYLKKTLDKVGVAVEVEHVGKYKDAPDMFTRTSMSPETREVLNSVLDSLYGNLVQTIAAGRRQSPEQVKATIDRGPFIAQQALESGLVDGLIYQDQMFGELKKRLKLKDISRVPQSDYMHVAPESVGLAKGPRVAMVVAEGDIVRGGPDDGPPTGGFVAASEFNRLLRRVRDDNLIRGVIVRIDSPGGDGFASDEIWREMELLSQRKPVVISMSDLAASGGYYMAMTGDPILAYPGTYTGSIGVFYGKVNLRGLYDKLGVTKDLLTRGRFAAIDSDYQPLSEAARQKLQNDIEVFYKSFVEKVAKARKRPYDQVEALAQGRVWLGSQARQNGLIDELGGIDRALELVKQKAKIAPSQSVRLVAYPPRHSIIEELFSRATSISAFDSDLGKLLQRFSTGTWARGGIFRLMPYTIDVK